MKRRLRALLVERRFDEIAEVAAQTRRTLGVLVSLTFDREPLIAWRAVEAMGVAAARIADDDPGAVRELLRRLNWLMTEESGGICWRAPEAMADIVRRCPGPCAAFIPIIVHLLEETAEEDLHHFRAGMLWAIGRLGPVASEHVDAVLPAMVGALDHADSQVRGVAAWALGQVGRAALVAGDDLTDDAGPVDLYEDGELRRTTVGEVACRARR